MNLLNSRTWFIDSFIKSDKSIFEFIKHVYITWGVLKLKLAIGRFPFPYWSSFDNVMCCVQHSCFSQGKWLFLLLNRNHPCEIRHFCLYLWLTSCWYLPLCCLHVVTGTFGMLLPSFYGSFALGRAITASLTLMMLSLVVPLLANLVRSCQRFFSPYRTSFIRLLKANRVLLACDLWNAPLLSIPMRVLFNHRFSPFEFSERSESQLLFPTQS